VRELVRQVTALDEEPVLLAMKDVVTLDESRAGFGGEGDQQIVFRAAAQMLLGSIVADRRRIET
jgi:hypothetical protein